MLRRFTRDVGPRFKAGNTHNYPRSTWKKIEADAKRLDPKANPDLDAYSKAVDHDPLAQSMLKGRGAMPRARLGAAR